jgi:hypothetical protein
MRLFNPGLSWARDNFNRMIVQLGGSNAIDPLCVQAIFVAIYSKTGPSPVVALNSEDDLISCLRIAKARRQSPEPEDIWAADEILIAFPSENGSAFARNQLPDLTGTELSLVNNELSTTPLALKAEMTENSDGSCEVACTFFDMWKGKLFRQLTKLDADQQVIESEQVGEAIQLPYHLDSGD